MREPTRIIVEGDIDALLLHANDPMMQEYARTSSASGFDTLYGIASNPRHPGRGLDDDALAETIGTLFTATTDHVWEYQRHPESSMARGSNDTAVDELNRVANLRSNDDLSVGQGLSE